MRRRRFAAVAGSVLLCLPGCTDAPAADPAQQGSTPTPTGTAPNSTPTRTEPADDPPADDPRTHRLGERSELGDQRVSIESAAVRDVGLPPYAAFAVLEDPDGWQFVVVGVEVDGPGGGAFDLAYHPLVDGDPLEYAAAAPDYGGPPLDSSDDPAIPAADGPDIDGGTPVAIPVPTGEYDAVAVRVRGGDDGTGDANRETAHWSLPDAVVDDLAHEPEYRVHEADLEMEADIELAITIENAGDRDGVYQGVIVLRMGADIDQVFTVAVPAGETVTQRIPVGVLSADRVDEDDLPEVEQSGPGGRTFRI